MDYTQRSRQELIALCKERGLKGYSGASKAALVEMLSAVAATVTATTQQTGKNKSPLRYPGGKTRAIAILERYCKEHYPGRTMLLSPFFGGGSFELHMQSKGFGVCANDLFSPLYTFWTVLQTNPEGLAARIQSKMPVTKAAFLNMRAAVLTEEEPLEKAALYFCINRCSFSGATLSGGFSQQAADGRLTAASLGVMKACRLQGIQFTGVDCLTFLEQHPETDKTLVFADPPYYISTYIYGKDGDMHESFNHASFAAAIQKRRDWILTYNDCPYIRELYKGCRIFQESWSYGMNATKKSSEIIILPPVAGAAAGAATVEAAVAEED
jgi:DNA adenine methylase